MKFQGQAVFDGSFGAVKKDSSITYRNDTNGCGENSSTIIQNNNFTLQIFLVAVVANTSTVDVISGDDACASSSTRMSCGLSNARCGICGMLVYQSNLQNNVVFEQLYISE